MNETPDDARVEAIGQAGTDRCKQSRDGLGDAHRASKQKVTVTSEDAGTVETLGKTAIVGCIHRSLELAAFARIPFTTTLSAIRPIGTSTFLWMPLADNSNGT